MKEKITVLIRVDAKKEVALGHLKRCISLANELESRGFSVFFLVAKDIYTEDLLNQSGFLYGILNSDTNTESDYRDTVTRATDIGASIIIIDSYEIDNTYRKKIMAHGFFVASVTDTAYMVLSSDIVINGNLNAEKLMDRASSECELLLGIKYLILATDFKDNVNETETSEEVENILITMGGIDHYDLTTKILKMLDTFDLDFNISAIVGPYYENLPSIRAQVDKMHKKVKLIKSPPTLYEIMKHCSLAFCAGGQTVYELAALAKPVVGISLWEHQKDNIDNLSALGAIKGVSYLSNNFDLSLRKSTEKLLSSYIDRKHLRDTASSIVDGKGAIRVADGIVDNYTRWLDIRLERRML